MSAQRTCGTLDEKNGIAVRTLTFRFIDLTRSSTVQRLVVEPDEPRLVSCWSDGRIADPFDGRVALAER